MNKASVNIAQSLNLNKRAHRWSAQYPKIRYYV